MSRASESHSLRSFAQAHPEFQNMLPSASPSLVARLELKNIYPGNCQIFFLNPFYVGAFDVIFRPMNETHQGSVVEVSVLVVDAQSQYRFDFNVSMVSPANTGIGLSTWDVQGVGIAVSPPLVVGPNILRVEQAPTPKNDLGWDSVVLSNTHDGHGWACHWCEVYKY